MPSPAEVAAFETADQPGAAQRGDRAMATRRFPPLPPLPISRPTLACGPGIQTWTRPLTGSLGRAASLWDDQSLSNASSMAMGMRGFDRVQLPGNASRGCRSGLVKRRQKEVTGNRQPALALAA